MSNLKKDGYMKEDQPKSLGSPDECKKRLNLLNAPHILLLTKFVNKIRQKYPLDWHVPYFDPCDGGIKAKCLFVFESPGPKSVVSGFISRNNHDETANKFFKLNEETGLPRIATVTWNIVPWYIGTDRKITRKDIKEGLKYLEELISLLSELKVVVLVGEKAQSVEKDIGNVCKGLNIFKCCHPSPQALNTDKTRQDRIRDVLRRVTDCLGRVPKQ